MSIPRNLQFQSKVESAPARRYRTNISPQNGSGTSTSGYAASNTIIINIPTRNNTALIPSESFLRFNLKATATTASISGAFDSHGAHQVINRLRVFHGSNLLQDIADYGQLAKILYDYQMPMDATQGRFNITTGTAADLAGSGITATINADGVVVKPINRGRTLPVIATGGTELGTFSINLISLVGALAGNKYLPLWEMTGAPLRVELVLQPSLQTILCAGNASTVAGSFNLYNCDFIAEFLELPDSAIAAIKAGSSNPLQMVVPDWRSYAYSASIPNASTTQISMPIPAKYSSLKSIVVAHRSTQGGEGVYPSSHITAGVRTYTFRVGSEVLPSTAPSVQNTDTESAYSEFFSEACKCFGSLADLSYQPSIDLDAYAGQVVATSSINTVLEVNTTNSGAFLVGIDLEAYQNADKSSIFAGMNTNTSDIFYQPTHYQSTGGAVNCYYTAFANFDTVIVCENGVAYSRF
jgi:hypothetical protein